MKQIPTTAQSFVAGFGIGAILSAADLAYNNPDFYAGLIGSVALWHATIAAIKAAVA